MGQEAVARGLLWTGLASVSSVSASTLWISQPPLSLE